MSDKKAWLIIGGLLIIVGAVLTIVIANKGDITDISQPSSGKSIADENNSQGHETPAPTAAGAYVDYNEQTFTNTQGRRWLFFHAGWCPQCRALEEDIKKEGVPDGLTIFKVNYDTATELKKKYGVTLQTTVVEVDESGNEVRKFVAYDDPTLQAVMNALGG